jgi:hypothetical protein
MGLFSKKRDAQGQQAAFGLGGGVAGQMAYAQLAQKLHQSGVQANAVVNAVRPTGQVDFGGAPEIDFDVTITKPTGETYATTVRQGMNAAQANEIRQGATVSVKYDADNPAQAMIYGW